VDRTGGALSQQAIPGFAGLMVCVAFAAFMEAINLRFIYLTHSLAPLMDSWGNITPSQLWGNFFAHHNEHRIIIPRVLLLIDTYFNAGRETFLIAATHIMLAVNGCLMGYLGRQLFGGGKLMQATLSALLTGFFLGQQQGLVLSWGILVCWPLVYAFSISAYVVLFEVEIRWSYAVAFILALFAALTLANGVLSLVPVIVLAIFLRDARLFWFASVSSGLLVALHFWGLQLSQPPAFEGGLLLHTVVLVKYALAYIGAPLAKFIEYLSGAGPDPDATTSVLVGGLLVLVFALVSVPALFTRRLHNVSLALIALCGFVLVSAFTTAAGRLSLGILQATDGRYSTSATLFTAALAMLFTKSLLKRWRVVRAPIGVAVFALMVGAAFFQVGTARRDRESANARKLPTAALLSRVNDQTVMWLLYPTLTIPPAVVSGLADNHLSLFADEWSNWFGKPLPIPVKTGICSGYIDATEAVKSEPGALRLRGWASRPGHDIKTLRLVFADRSGVVIGYGFTGWPRPDVPATLPNVTSEYTGWFGYVRPHADNPLVAYLLVDDDKAACHIP
jgi:hypothetical protein